MYYDIKWFSLLSFILKNMGYSYFRPKIPCFCNHIYSSLPDVLSLPLKVYGISRRSKTSR